MVVEVMVLCSLPLFEFHVLAGSMNALEPLLTTLPPSHAYFLYPSHTGGMKTDWLGLEQEKIQNDHHSERRKGISNQEREGDTMEMESRSLESDILSFQIIRVKRV